MRRSMRWFAGLGAVTAAVLALATASCGSTVPRRDPTSERFPSVVGESLRGESVAVPATFAGRPVVLLVAYLQSSQFDLDRWLLGMTQAGVTAEVRELPTIPGLAPRAFSGWIDGGMRRGIPSEDWGSVVTVYGDAATIAAFTGNEEGLPGRVLLLDAEGHVVFFHDSGYSVGALTRLQAELARLEATAPAR